MSHPFNGYSYRRIAADRDIQPEKDDRPDEDFSEGELSPNGVGATTIIQRILQKDVLHGKQLPAFLIEEDLLDDLNFIYGPDADFDGIEVKRLKGQIYEVFISEKEKGLVALTQTGSGLKTVILVLLNLIVYPKLIHPRPLNNFVFAFEELENNLHPAIQRRLFLYLRNMAVREGCHFFLTTHSNIVIDLFGRDDQAQTLHVTHDRTEAKVQTISTYLHKHSILKDLDVRASDLLQANAVVWVEGPSDRIYFNKWIELWDVDINECIHYQCLYSGGGLIAGYTFDAAGPSEDTDPDEKPDSVENVISTTKIQEFIEALKINRHSIVMMDRDRAEGEELKEWVSRIAQELDQNHGLPWITAGREVENYIPTNLVTELVEDKNYKTVSSFGQYDSFFKCYTGPRDGKLSGYKTEIARWVADRLTIEHIRSTLDLTERLEAVCDRIRSWNGLEQCPNRANPGDSGAS